MTGISNYNVGTQGTIGTTSAGSTNPAGTIGVSGGSGVSGTPISSSLPQVVKDTLTTSASTNASVNIAASNNPSLTSPDFTSLGAFFQTISTATLSFQNQQVSSSLIDIQTKAQMNNQASIEALSLVQQLAAADAARLQVVTQTNDAISGLNTAMNDAATKSPGVMNPAINTLNSGNSEEQAQDYDWVSNYNSFTQAIETQLGATYQGNGNFYIPPGTDPQATADQYNALAAQYNQGTVDNFNAYWTGSTGRLNQINQYNQTATTYNSNISADNTSIQGIINGINATDPKTGSPDPDFNPQPPLTAPTAQVRDTSQLPSQASYTNYIASGGVTVQTNPPPNSIEQICFNGLSNYPNLSYAPVNANTFESQINQKLYDNLVAPLLAQLNVSFAAVNYANLQFLYLIGPRLDAQYPNPFSVVKKAARSILPPAYTTATHPVATASVSGAGALAAQVIGLGAPHISALLGQAILTQVVDQLSLDRAPKDDLVHQLQILTTGLLHSNTFQAIEPLLKSLLPLLSQLNPDSGAIPALIASSLANTIANFVNQGLGSQALANFIASNPTLASLNLTPAQQSALASQLTNAINLVLGLTATNLLTTSLGVPELLPQILAPILAEATGDQSIAQSFIADGIQAQNLNQVQNEDNIQQYYVNQGYNNDQAQLLAQTSTEVLSQGITPPPPETVSPDTVQTQVLEDSITSGIILANQQANLQTTQAAVQAAIQATYNQENNQSTPPSVSQFSQDLALNLRTQGLSNQATEQGIANALFIPLASAAANNSQVLSLGDQAAIVNSRLQNLINQIGSELGQKVKDDTNLALYGTTNPDSGDLADTKSSGSLVNVTRATVARLNITNDQKVFAAAIQTFKDTILPSIEPSVFLTKILDPFVGLLMALNGIMSGGTLSGSAPNTGGAPKVQKSVNVDMQV